MKPNRHPDPPGTRAPRAWRRPVVLAAASAAVVVAFFVLREHGGHVLDFAPYLILAACPLMHFLHGHGGHGRRGSHAERPPDPPRERS